MYLVSRKPINRRWRGMRTAHLVGSGAFTCCGAVCVLDDRYELHATPPDLTSLCERCAYLYPQEREKFYGKERK